MDELSAIAAYQRGDADAFAVLFELHAAHVYRTAYLITRDARWAEDVAQETFMILAQRLPGLAPGPLRSWLGRVAANLSLNSRRRAWELPLESLPAGQRAFLDARDAAPGPESGVAAAEERARVSDPAIVPAVHGITLTLTTVTRGIGVSRIVTHLDEEPRVGPVTSAGDVLLDARGQRIPFADARGSGGVPLGGHFTFTSTYGFATPPSGARLVLVIPGMQYDNTPVGTAGAVIQGPWRLPFVMP